MKAYEYQFLHVYLKPNISRNVLLYELENFIFYWAWQFFAEYVLVFIWYFCLIPGNCTKWWEKTITKCTTEKNCN